MPNTNTREVDIAKQAQLVSQAVSKAAMGEDCGYYYGEVYVYPDYAVICTMEGDYKVPYTIAEHVVTVAPKEQWVQVTKEWADVPGGTPPADTMRAIRMTGQLAADTFDHYLRGYCERAAKDAKPGDPIRFIASTENVARDGMVIEAKGWELDNFRNNPIVLWSHDIIGARPPIGRADVKVDGQNLIADIRFDMSDPFAAEVDRKYRAGFLHAVSVRWDPKEMAPARNGQPRRFTRQDLLEISAVALPSDPSALKQERIRAIQDELSELTKPADVADPPTPTWPEVAADMTALILFPTARAGKAWRLEYHRLSRLYDQLGKEPPERLAPDYLAALDTDAVSGLFLEDERDVCPDLFTQRAAASVPHPLTAADRADLAQVVERLQAVLARDAEPQSTEPEQVEHAEEAVASPALLSLASILGVR